MIELSFIVPAYNEEILIGDTLQHIADASKSLTVRCEVIVVDDDSTDATAAVAAKHGAKVIPVRCRQISAVRNAGARSAQGEWLIFVDADTRVTMAAVTAAVAALKEGAAGGGCNVRFDGPLPLYARLLIGTVGPMYRAFGLAAGCFVFCSRQAFQAVGGFDETVYAAEEVILSRALREHGRFVILREHVVTSGRKLRTYSSRHLLAALFRVAIGGRVGLRRPEGKEIWYGERRNDTASRVAADGKTRKPSNHR
jgi:glycosyltransferase involved in cell wall biosynthesis